jgi:hypothetical protein
MKNLFILTVFALVALTSCKKDYVCSFDDNTLFEDVEYNDLDKDEAEAAKASCELLGGDWSVD